MKFLFSIVCVLIVCHAGFSQQTRSSQRFTLSGTIIDSAENTPMIGVTLILRSVRDSSQWRGVVTDNNGKFQFQNVRSGVYGLKVSYIGYTLHQRRIVVGSTNVDIGNLKMTPSATLLKSVEVSGTAIGVEQKGDTVQYNANAYKTNPDASAEDLITKMPGITSDGTGVKVQGENVQQVLVDGKQFFGDDANLALKNLPAEIIDKIEVFDRLSEQSQFTGFDDGQTRKTINIVTRKGVKTGKFGKISAGIGENGRYTAGANVNSFKGDRKLTLIGLTNNINQQNFSTDDLLGVTGNISTGGGGGRGGRGGGGGRGGSQNGGAGSNFLVGQQSGISTTHSGGLNYSNEWGDKIEFSGSYFFNTAENERITNLSRLTLTQRDSGLIYLENNQSDSRNTNHRMNFRLEYDIDTANSIVISPRLSLQLNDSRSGLTGFNTSGESVQISKLNNFNNSNNLGYNFSNNFLFRHRFAKRGRSISLSMNVDLNDREGDSKLYSLNEYFLDEDRTNEVDQRLDQFTNSSALSSNIAFTEPIGKKGQLQFDYTVSLTRSDTDKKTFNMNPETDLYSELDTLLTNEFKNNYLSNRGGLSYRLNVQRKYNFMAGLNFQHARLSSDQDFPRPFELGRSFYNLLPQVSFNYRFAQGENFRVFYRTSTNAPSISQLQNVVNNRNPLFLRSGNSDLEQDYQQTLTLRYGRTNAEKGRSFLLFMYGSYVQDYIGNATFVANKDTIINEIPLLAGTQLTYPINVTENWSARTFVIYGVPIKLIKSNLNLNTGFNYNRTPALINSETNLAHNYALSQGIVLSSNISENFDFTLSYTANYTIVKNTMTMKQQSDNNYFTHLSSLRLACQPWKGLVFNSSVTNSFYNGLSAEFDQFIWFWNASLGYKLLKDRSLEIKISAFDLLNQNKSINREVSDTFIEDSQTSVLTRYFLLMVTYNLRDFK